MAKYLDATGVSTLWGKIKSSFASSGHNHDGRYLQYAGWWSSGNGNNADDATGMVFAYSNHNVPSGWGILTTFEYQRSSGYKMQLFSNGYTDGETYYRNRSSDRGGWGSWVRFLDSTNYTSYAARASHTHPYLPLSGGTLTGSLSMNNTSSITNLPVSGGIYWNPYVESSSDSSDAASITLVKSGVVGGTTLVITQNNDANDTIQFVTNSSASLYHNSNKIWDAGNDGSGSGLDADTVDGYNASRLLESFGSNNYVTFTVEGDANTYYPVLIGKPAAYYPYVFLTISRTYNEKAPNTWNTETHRGGLSMCLFWNCSCYWDGNSSGMECYCVRLNETYCNMVAGMDRAVGYEVVWLRGGGAVYHIHGPAGVSQIVSVCLDGYTDQASQTFSPRTWDQRVSISVRWPGYSQGSDYASSAGSVAWAGVSNKPETATRWPSWGEVSGKPSTFTPSSHTHNYLPLSGGTLSGNITFSHSGTDNPVYISSVSGSYYQRIALYDEAATNLPLFKIQESQNSGTTWTDYFTVYKDKATIGNNTLYHSGNLPAYPTKASWNYDDKYLKLSGGTLSGSLGVKNDLNINLNDWDNDGGIHINEGGSQYHGFDISYGSGDLFKIIRRNGQGVTENVITIPRSESNVTFSANIYASGFCKTGSDNSYILLGAGGHKAVSDFATSGHNHNSSYVSAVAISGNSLRVTKNGSNSDLTIPYSTSAGSATSASYLPPKYDGGDKPNPQSYFNENIGAKVAMTRYATIGGTTSWFDTLWINGYAGSDVPNMVALTTIRNGTPRAFLSAQSSRSTTYGTYYELISSYNIASQSVNYATSSGTANSPRGFSFSDRSSNDWTGVPGTFITDWSHSSGADIMFKNDGAKLNVITDGRFYQGIDVYGSSKRVLDEYDITHTTWGNADTLDGYHYNTLYTSIGDWISKVGNTYTITVNGDSDTYYPVVIDATFDKTSRNFISIWKNLGSPTANYQYNHSNGTSSMWLIIEGRSCAWDGNGGYYRTIYRSQPYANLISEATTVCSSVSVLCVYLRGGGTEYKISTTYPTTVRVYLEETNLGSTTYPAIVNPRTNVANGGIINGTFYGNCTGNASTATSASSVPSLSNSEIDTIMV